MGHRGRIRSCLIVAIVFGGVQYIFRLSQISFLASNKQVKSAAQEVIDKKSFVQQKVSDEKHVLKNRKRLGPIFYNVFIPANDTDKQKNALRIIQEQVQQRAWSDPNSPLWYTLIGARNTTMTEDELFQPNCRQLQHVPTGDEVTTLQALWEYCQDHSDMLVTYLHDKGSFHHTEHNEQTRRTATKAALDCRIEMANHPDLSPYNVCTGMLIILPQYLSKANMWTAKCKYIRQLVPPKDYEVAMQQFYNETILLDPKYACSLPIHWKDNHLGLGRYAYERWVWSHPDVVPADVLPYRKINFTTFPPEWKPRLTRSLQGSPRRMHLHKGFGESSFARLEGRLLEWQFIYHQQPPNASWIWNYYQGYETGSTAYKIRYCRPGS